MRFKRRNVHRLASLSAVGAGAAFITADRAEASTITWSGNLAAEVGWYGSNSFGRSFASRIASGAGFTFQGTFSSRTIGARLSFSRAVRALGFGNLRFATANGKLLLVNAGALWNHPQTGSSDLVGMRIWTYHASRVGTSSQIVTDHSTRGLGNFTDRYALFTFTLGNGPLYGWVKLSQSVTNSWGGNNSYGPLVTVEGFAYDTTPNEKIAAGDTGISATPEPGTFALTGLAALALGAAGMRRWRAARAA